MIAGEFGITLRIQTHQDLTGHTAEALVIVAEDGTRLAVEPTVADPPTAGILEYTTEPDDFPAPGVYRLQATVDIGVGPSRRMRSAAADLAVAHAL